MNVSSFSLQLGLKLHLPGVVESMTFLSSMPISFRFPFLLCLVGLLLSEGGGIAGKRSTIRNTLTKAPFPLLAMRHFSIKNEINCHFP